jgi:hypothetical protein
MTENSLYYLFSTIAQVLAALSGLLAVFFHFKTSEMKDYLIGDGLATFERMKRKDIGYSLNIDETKYVDRLRDALGRKNLKGIMEIIDFLAASENKEGHTLATRPRGLQYLQKQFRGNLRLLNHIKSITKQSIGFAFFTILISITSIVGRNHFGEQN